MNDLGRAAEYYKEILDENPDDWEAYFYFYLGENCSFTNAQAGNVARKIGNAIPHAYDLAIASASGDDETNQRLKTITNATTSRLQSIAMTAKSLLSCHEGGDVFTAEGRVNSNMFDGLWPTVTNTICGVVDAFDELDKKLVMLSGTQIASTPEPFKSCLLTIRSAQYNVANIEYRATDAHAQKAIKDEYIKMYADKVKEISPDSAIANEIDIEQRGFRFAVEDLPEQDRQMIHDYIVQGKGPKAVETYIHSSAVNTRNYGKGCLAIDDYVRRHPELGMKRIYDTDEKLKWAKETSTNVDRDLAKKSSSGGCYVATAVYGSYDCPQVWTLRRFRDYDLASSIHGRAFIKAYYAISPMIVKWFGDTEFFKQFWRDRLDSLVKRCQDMGYADTPYEDQTW